MLIVASVHWFCEHNLSKAFKVSELEKNVKIENNYDWPIGFVTVLKFKWFGSTQLEENFAGSNNFDSFECSGRHFKTIWKEENGFLFLFSQKSFQVIFSASFLLRIDSKWRQKVV